MRQTRQTPALTAKNVQESAFRIFMLGLTDPDYNVSDHMDELINKVSDKKELMKQLCDELPQHEVKFSLSSPELQIFYEMLDGTRDQLPDRMARRLQKVVRAMNVLDLDDDEDNSDDAEDDDE